ncbi:MAG: hypothetical protein R3A12_10230 [Ignavibacteria bacterium]
MENGLKRIDWALSRSRFWGTPPCRCIFDDDGNDHYECFGSIEELRSIG